MRPISSVGKPTDDSAITMVTSPASGIPAAPMAAAVATMLKSQTRKPSDDDGLAEACPIVITYRLWSDIAVILKQWHWSRVTLLVFRSGARPTNDISFEFEIRPKFAVLWFKNVLCESQQNFAHVTTVKLFLNGVNSWMICSCSPSGSELLVRN